MRATGNKAMKTNGAALIKGNFKHAGDLYDCHGCGAHCNMCQYKSAALKTITASKAAQASIKVSEAKFERIENRVKNNNDNCNMFA